VSHRLRIEIAKALAEKPLRFADLKRNLERSSSGLLDSHLKKLDDLLTIIDRSWYFPTVYEQDKPEEPVIFVEEVVESVKSPQSEA
jgi:DNA-binding HxlR family transcriptional regulator